MRCICFNDSLLFESVCCQFCFLRDSLENFSYWKYACCNVLSILEGFQTNSAKQIIYSKRNRQKDTRILCTTAIQHKSRNTRVGLIVLFYKPFAGHENLMLCNQTINITKRVHGGESTITEITRIGFLHPDPKHTRQNSRNSGSRVFATDSQSGEFIYFVD